MAVAFGSISNTTYGGGRTSTTVTAPTGITNGDLLVAHILVSGNGTTVTAPSGWTLLALGGPYISNDGSFYLASRIYTKVAASESGSYSWTHASSSSQGTIARYTGASGVINAYSSNCLDIPHTPSSRDRTATSITTTVNGCMLIMPAYDWADTTLDLTPPTGMTEREDVTLSYWADVLQTTSGSTGDYTMFCNVNNGGGAPRGAWLIALEPTGAGGAVTVNLTGGSLGAATTLGSVSVSVKGIVNLTGTSAAGTVGDVVIANKASTTLTGVSAAGTVGNVTVSNVTNAAGFPLGIGVTADIGTLGAGTIYNVKVAFTGWGTSSWSDQSWSQINFLTGQMIGTVGGLGVSAAQRISVTGVSATASNGSVSTIAGATTVIFLNGEQADTAQGDVSVASSNRVTLTGIAQPAVVGNVTILLSQNVQLTGVSAVCYTQLVSNRATATISVTGVEAFCAVGDPFVQVWSEVVTPSTTTWTPTDDSASNPWAIVSTPSNNWTPKR